MNKISLNILIKSLNQNKKIEKFKNKTNLRANNLN